MFRYPNSRKPSDIIINDNKSKTLVKFEMTDEEAASFDCKMFPTLPEGDVYKWTPSPKAGGGVIMTAKISTAKKK